MRRKVSTTFTIELDQLERLNQLSARTRITRSLIVRDAIERELQRYEQAEDRGKVVVGGAAEWGGVAVEALAKRP